MTTGLEYLGRVSYYTAGDSISNGIHSSRKKTLIVTLTSHFPTTLYTRISSLASPSLAVLRINRDINTSSFKRIMCFLCLPFTAERTNDGYTRGETSDGVVATIQRITAFLAQNVKNNHNQ